MKVAIFLFIFLAANVNATLSLEKPISVMLSDSEVVEHESTIRQGDFSSNDFKDTLIFEGILLNVKVKNDGESIYKFKVKKSLSNRKHFRNNRVQIIAPTKVENGGVDLKIGKQYRVCAPVLPDGRYALWRGTIIELIDP